MERSEPQPFDWTVLVPFFIHPVRVEIIEAMHWIGEPLSASDLNKVLEGRFGSPYISYHLLKLAEVKVIEKVRERQVRGAMEKFFSLS
jgi:repressor of nif and glnA expression